MNIEVTRNFFLWCTIINSGMLLIWWLMFLAGGGDWIFRIHTRFVRLERAQFDAMHYAGMGLYKVAIFLFNLVPYIALRIIA